MSADPSYVAELAEMTSRRTGLPTRKTLVAALVLDAFLDRFGPMPFAEPIPVVREWTLELARELVRSASLSPREMCLFCSAVFAIAAEEHPAAPPPEMVDPIFEHVALLFEEEAKLVAMGAADA